MDLSTGEMAHMFYSTLGGLAYCTTGGVCDQAGFGLTNTGPFSNLQPSTYWSGTTYAPSTSRAWLFFFNDGGQSNDDKSNNRYAWAVRPGDIAGAPVPGAVWLLSGALAALGAVRRRAMNKLG